MPKTVVNVTERFSLPVKQPVGAKYRINPGGMTNKFVSQTVDGVAGSGRNQIKLPQILNLRQKLQKLQQQEKDEEELLREAERSFVTQAREELGETFYQDYLRRTKDAIIEEEQEEVKNQLLNVEE